MAKKAQSETKDIAHFQKTAFGRHETFALRYGWLTKGYQAAQKDPKIFQSDEATVTLGVGVNMVNSIQVLAVCLSGDRSKETREFSQRF
jgi:hypothetical protein